MPNTIKSVDELEQIAQQKIFPEIMEILNYLGEIYVLCFQFGSCLHEKPIKDINIKLTAKMMILMRVSDFIRGIQLQVSRGYPEQAATLAASVFELVHTGIAFSFLDNAANKWLNTNSYKNKMPALLSEKTRTWEMLVKQNYEFLGSSNYKSEYKIYQQLCWIKHSHPIMNTILLENNAATFQVGPYSDEESINHAWFSMLQSARLAMLLMISLKNEYIDIFDTISSYNSLYEKGLSLSKEATEKFKNFPNPFEIHK